MDQPDVRLFIRPSPTIAPDARDLLFYDVERHATCRVERSEVRLKGKKSPEVWLGVANVAVAAIGAVLTAVSIWRASRPSFSVTVRRGDVVVEMANLNRAQFGVLVDRIKSQAGDLEIDLREP